MSKVRAPTWLRRLWEKEGLEVRARFAKMKRTELGISDEQRKQIRKRVQAARNAQDVWRGGRERRNFLPRHYDNLYANLYVQGHAQCLSALQSGRTFAVDNYSQLYDVARQYLLNNHFQQVPPAQLAPSYQVTQVSNTVTDPSTIGQFYGIRVVRSPVFPWGLVPAEQYLASPPHWRINDVLDMPLQGVAPKREKREFYFKSCLSADNDLSRYTI